MLATLIPLFDQKMEVSAYSVFAKKQEMFSNPLLEGTASLDGAGRIDGFEIVNSVGLHGLAGERSIFIAINNISIYTDIKSQCHVPCQQVILLMDHSIPVNESTLARAKELRAEGFRLAIRKIPVDDFQEYGELFKLCEYFFIDYKKIDMKVARAYFGKFYPETHLVAVNINDKYEYEYLSDESLGGRTSYDLYEGEFFRMPVDKAQTDVSPMKANYIELLNIINAPDFDLTDAAKVIGRDVALVISLLEMVNRMTVNSEITSVQHATAMLGQRELKKWINTAVARELCSDKPSEIVRLSMIRARFCENLAIPYELAMSAPELFLLGLFSVLDVMLDTTMEDALSKVQVSKHVQDALLRDAGPLAQVLDFVKAYEDANWAEVSRVMLLKNLDEKRIYDAYLDALRWYGHILMPRA